ncbi:MAG: NUDIX hydrolase [Bacteroidota bacterium]
MRKTDVTVKIIFRLNNKALIMHHRNGIFDLPGGRIEFGESPLEALKRELKEELNYSLTKKPKFFNVWNYLSKNRKRHSIFLTYILRLSRMPKIHSSEKANLLWLTKKEFLNRRVIKNKKFVQAIFG